MSTFKNGNLLLVVLISLLLINCSPKEPKKIANRNDYQSYLEVTDNKKLESIGEEIKFWQTKYDAAPNQSSYLITLASQYSQLFEIKGTIDDLYKAEMLLLEANEKFAEQNSGIHRAIARNYISQHRFREALLHLEKAEVLGENKLGTNKMLFDVYMELGSYDLAKQKLSAIAAVDNFDYLIRLAKWNDHLGDLKTAISCMESAKKIADENNDDGLKIWVYTNIADFYGHAGRIQESYDHYLKALSIDKHNSYALKGIAWISFSYERNAEQALEIINNITSKHLVPDLYLLKAEIAQFQNDNDIEGVELEKYKEILASKNYGDMYNKYNVLLMAENPEEVDKAILISQKEVKNRPTPESYDLLAWSYYNKGDFQKAYEISIKNTINKSHEPLILFHNELILKANNKLTKENSNKEDLIASIYELGPNLEDKIRSL